MLGHHLIGTAKQRDGDSETEGLGCLEIDDQLNFCRLHDRRSRRADALWQCRVIEVKQTLCVP
jgi:hypothetical protein